MNLHHLRLIANARGIRGHATPMVDEIMFSLSPCELTVGSNLGSDRMPVALEQSFVVSLRCIGKMKCHQKGEPRVGQHEFRNLHTCNDQILRLMHSSRPIEVRHRGLVSDEQSPHIGTVKFMSFQSRFRIELPRNHIRKNNP